MGVLLLQPLGLSEVPLYLLDLALHVHNRSHLSLQKTIQVVQVVLDIASYLVSLISQFHVLLGQLYGLVYVAFMLLYQFLLLLQNELNVLVVFFA